ncbi:hypothetical protein [Brevundimonas sp. NPDC046655]|uniref:hypothetical protein n=1 Tax=unclassified Brevundimonas TaxID=2622653 RepID=UPI00384F65AA
MLAFNDRVAVIDDDEDGRDTIIDELGDHNYKGVAITGRYGSDIQRLLSEIEAQDPGFVICDHRLTAQQFASFNGLQVVEALIARKRPAMLLTTFQDPERITLRAARSRVPVIRGRDGFRIEEIARLRDLVQMEIDQKPVASRRPHQVLLRVEAVRTQEVDVVVPSWRRDHALVVPRTLLGPAVRNVVKKGDYLLGDVNIGAAHEDELYFANLNEIVPPAEGLE